MVVHLLEQPTTTNGRKLCTGINPAGIAAGDFEGSTTLDLAVTNFNDNTVSILVPTP
jgi:hypothetical protein